MLYVASAIEVGSTSGGSTHVNEVACGLRDLGHEVLVIARGNPKSGLKLDCGIPVRAVKYRQQLALLGFRTVRRAIQEFKPQVVMERFYNFAGAGVLLAHRRGIPSLLEVNAPMIDPPGSLKSKIDRVLLGSMRRWAVRQARWSAAIVTPLNTTVPPEVSRRRIHELPWGGNVDRFDPAIRATRKAEIEALRQELGLPAHVPTAVFLGSFRAWHGVGHFVEAARKLIESGSDMNFLAIGGGPELAPLEEKVKGWGLPEGRFVFAGAQVHTQVPLFMALGDVGVAPFDLAASASLREFGFYWSPLKVFEYMAMQMPTVTIDVNPLNTIVRDGKDGLLYPSGDVNALVDRLRYLEVNKDTREKMGRSARERVVEKYSWHAHCVALDAILKEIAR